MSKHNRVTVTASTFENGYANLKRGPVPILDALAAKIKDTVHTLIVAGHTADDTSDVYNADLSLRRAEAVRDYLVGRGIALARIMTNGRGAAHPIALNTTAAGREQNRRVEVTISLS